MMDKKTWYFFAAVFLTVLVLAAGCGKKPGSRDKVVATVNNEPVYLKDLNRAIAINYRKDPLFRVTPNVLNTQVNVLIDRKLLIQEAVKDKLDQTEQFLDTMKAFWEQTLIRVLMDHKEKEFAGSVSVSDGEIRDYYDKMSHGKTFLLVRSGDRETLEKLIITAPENISWEESVGPVSYGDLVSGILMDAFAMKKGEMKIFPDNRGLYYLVYVKEDEIVPVPGFDEVKDDIRQRLSRIKEQKMLNAWLRELRDRSDITVNEDVIKVEKFKYE